MIDEKIARVKKLIEQREAIDAELASLFNITTAKRGRPRKDAAAGESSGETNGGSRTILTDPLSHSPLS